MKVYHVIEGPFEGEDNYYLVANVVLPDSDKLETVELYFNTFDEAYNFVNESRSKFDPIDVAEAEYNELD